MHFDQSFILSVALTGVGAWTMKECIYSHLVYVY